MDTGGTKLQPAPMIVIAEITADRTATLKHGAAVPSSPSAGDDFPDAVSRAKSEKDQQQGSKHAKQLSILQANEIRQPLELVLPSNPNLDAVRRMRGLHHSLGCCGQT